MPLPAGLVEFLSEQPGMRLMPGSGADVRLRGTYSLDAEHPVAGHIVQDYALEIVVPATFPAQPPLVFEVGTQIPNDSDFHVNTHDGSLCLGSPLALWRVLREWPDLQVFLAKTLRPYLYAVTEKLRHGGDFVFGELRHGTAGQLQDLADALQLPEARVAAALDRILMPATRADNLPCPCDCGRPLRECELWQRLNDLRNLAPESWLRRLLVDIVNLSGPPP